MLLGNVSKLSTGRPARPCRGNRIALVPIFTEIPVIEQQRPQSLTQVSLDKVCRHTRQDMRGWETPAVTIVLTMVIMVIIVIQGELGISQSSGVLSGRELKRKFIV